MNHHKTKKQNKKCKLIKSKKCMKGGDVTGNTSADSGYKKIKHIESVISVNEEMKKQFGDIIHLAKDRIENELKSSKNLDIVKLIANGITKFYKEKKNLSSEQDVEAVANSVIESIDHLKINRYIEKAINGYMSQKIIQLYNNNIKSKQGTPRYSSSVYDPYNSRYNY